MTTNITINGELMWCKWMKEFNLTFSDTTNKYECTVGQINDADCLKLESLGIKVKQSEKNGRFIVGKSVDPKYYNVRDKKGNLVDTDTIGNGTKVTVLLHSYTHKLSPKHGNAPSINGITINELVTYNPNTVVEAELDDVL